MGSVLDRLQQLKKMKAPDPRSFVGRAFLACADAAPWLSNRSADTALIPHLDWLALLVPGHGFCGESVDRYSQIGLQEVFGHRIS
jgi:hypothetical protein